MTKTLNSFDSILYEITASSILLYTHVHCRHVAQYAMPERCHM